MENGSTFLLSLGQFQVMGLNVPPRRDWLVTSWQFERCKEASKFQLK